MGREDVKFSRRRLSVDSVSRSLDSPRTRRGPIVASLSSRVSGGPGSPEVQSAENFRPREQNLIRGR